MALFYYTIFHCGVNDFADADIDLAVSVLKKCMYDTNVKKVSGADTKISVVAARVLYLIIFFFKGISQLLVFFALWPGRTRRPWPLNWSIDILDGGQQLLEN